MLYAVELASTLSEEEFRMSSSGERLRVWIEAHKPADSVVSRQQMYDAARQLGLVIVEAGKKWGSIRVERDETYFCRGAKEVGGEVQYVAFHQGESFPVVWWGSRTREATEILYRPHPSSVWGPYEDFACELEWEFAEKVAGPPVHVLLEEPLVAVFPPGWMGRGYYPTVCLLSELGPMTESYAQGLLSARGRLADKLAAEQAKLDTLHKSGD